MDILKLNSRVPLKAESHAKSRVPLSQSSSFIFCLFLCQIVFRKVRTVSQISWLVWCHSHLLSILSYAVEPLSICLPWIPASFTWFLHFFCGFFCAGFVFFSWLLFCLPVLLGNSLVFVIWGFFFHLTGGSACDLYCKGFEAQMLHIKVVFEVISDTGLQAPVTFEHWVLSDSKLCMNRKLEVTISITHRKMWSGWTGTNSNLYFVLFCCHAIKLC